MTDVQRRLSVILFADVVGYSRLMGIDELGTLNALKAHREVIDPLFAEEGGRLVKTIGDGLLLEFPSAFHAVRAALAVQKTMAERNTDVPRDKRLVLRMGVHLGDVIVEEDDIFGDGVNIAARLESVATPGGICVSAAVYETIHKNIDAVFHDGGPRDLKNIAEPVHVYHLTLDGAPPPPAPTAAAVSAPVPATAKTGPQLSLVVLPFGNLTGNPRHDALVDGVTERLTGDLARIDGSVVVDRRTAAAYRGDTMEVAELGVELGVQYAIKGSARSVPGGVRLNTQLFDTQSGQPFWVDRFDVAARDPHAMQQEVVARLIPALHAQLLAAVGRAAAPAPTVPPPVAHGAAAHGAAAAGTMVVHPRQGPIAAVPAARESASGAPPAAAPAVAVRKVAVPARRQAGSSLRIPLWAKLAVVAIAGAVAATMLGPERNSVVEIVSWMLIAAGSVQMLGAMAGGARRV